MAIIPGVTVFEAILLFCNVFGMSFMFLEYNHFCGEARGALSIRTRLEIARDFGDQEMLPQQFGSTWIRAGVFLNLNLHL